MKQIIIFFSILILLNCKEDDSTYYNNPQTSSISGTIELPTNGSLEITSLKINSAIETEVISENNDYTIKVIKNETNFLYITDISGKVILMGFNYPNQTDFTINSESTLLAMFMSLPISQQLSTEGKTVLLNSLKNNPKLDNLKLQLEQIINKGGSPLDINQNDFALNLASFFDENINNNLNNKLKNEPINIYQQGREFIFQNPGKSYTTYVGIYKDNKRIKSIKLERVNFVPNSISQIFQGILNNLSSDIDIIETPYTLPSENGDYKIKIRTGRQLSGQEDYEATLALSANIKDIAMDIFLDLMSFKNQNLDCTQTLINNFSSFLDTADDFKNINSVQDALTFTYSKIEEFLTSSENIFFGCNPPNTSISSYLASITKKISWLKWIGIIGFTGNYSVAAYQWFKDIPILDLCYSINNNDVYKCKTDIIGIWNLEFPITINCSDNSSLDAGIFPLEFFSDGTVDWGNGYLGTYSIENENNNLTVLMQTSESFWVTCFDGNPFISNVYNEWKFTGTFETTTKYVGSYNSTLDWEANCLTNKDRVCNGSATLSKQ